MKMLKLIYNIPSVAFLVLIYSCNAQSTKQDFIARYHIGKIVPNDTTAKTLLKIKQAADWTISLEENDNFELTGTGKSIVGYWNVENISDNEYKLLLQGGGMAIFARFDGISMYFDKPYRMFDSLFSQVTFTRVRK